MLNSLKDTQRVHVMQSEWVLLMCRCMRTQQVTCMICNRCHVSSECQWTGEATQHLLPQATCLPTTIMHKQSGAPYPQAVRTRHQNTQETQLLHAAWGVLLLCIEHSHCRSQTIKLTQSCTPLSLSTFHSNCWHNISHAANTGTPPIC